VSAVGNQNTDVRAILGEVAGHICIIPTHLLDIE